MPAVLGGVAQDGVLAGDMREATEIRGVGELRTTGFNPLVASRADGEGITASDGSHRRFEQRHHSDAIRQIM